MRRWLSVLLTAGLGFGAAWAQTSPEADGAQRARLDALVQKGWDEPDAALVALDAQAPGSSASSPQRLDWIVAKGLVLASAGRKEAAEAVVAELVANPTRDTVVAAHAALLQALLADGRGAGKAVLEHVQSALAGYRQDCPAQPACDYRMQWRALMLVARYDRRRGQTATGLSSAQAAVDVAKEQADPIRQAWAMARL